MNSVTLMGRLVKDPNIKISQNENETKIARYTLAVNRKFAKQGEDTADFFSCICFGKVSDFAEKYLTKGEQIVIRGRLKTGSYVDKDGVKRYSTDVIVEEHYFCGSKPKDSKDVESDTNNE